MFRIIEGNVILIDEATGEALATVSGSNGIALQVREQNLDSEGYINNSSHNYAQYSGSWSPFTLTADGRLRVDVSSSANVAFLDLTDTPSDYTGFGDYYLRIKDTEDGIEFIPIITIASGISHFDIQDIGNTTHSGIDAHIADTNIHFPWSNVIAWVDTVSGTLQTQISQNASDIAYNLAYIISVSGTLQSEIDTHVNDSTIHFLESEISHFNIQDIGITTHSGIDVHIADLTIHFPWTDVTDLMTTVSGNLQSQITQNTLDIAANTAYITSVSGIIQNHIDDSTIHFLESDISHFNIQDIGVTTHSGIDAHIADLMIHFPWTDVTDLMTTVSGNLQSQITQNTLDIASNALNITTLSGIVQTHIDDTNIHFLESDISHFNIQDIGTTTHSGIDVHIADLTIHFPWTDVTDLVTTVSGVLQNQITQNALDIVANTSYITTVSGLLQTHIDDLTIHFPWTDVENLVTTVSGILSDEIDSDIATHASDPSAHHIRYTDEEAQDAVGNIMFGAGNVTVTYDDAGNIITISGTEGAETGNDYENNVSNSESSTSSTSYQLKVNLTTGSLDLGNYMLMWYAEGRNVSENDAIEMRIQEDNTLTHGEVRFYSGDDGGTNWLEDFQPFSGHIILESYSGSYSFDLDYRSVSGNSTEIRRARITIWRLN